MCISEVKKGKEGSCIMHKIIGKKYSGVFVRCARDQRAGVGLVGKVMADMGEVMRT